MVAILYEGLKTLREFLAVREANKSNVTGSGEEKGVTERTPYQRSVSARLETSVSGVSVTLTEAPEVI